RVDTLLLCFFFFFQAEDGIRDYKVTGVQTCALPISACRKQKSSCSSSAGRASSKRCSSKRRNMTTSTPTDGPRRRRSSDILARPGASIACLRGGQETKSSLILHGQSAPEKPQRVGDAGAPTAPAMAFMHFLVLQPVIFLAQQVAQPAITFEQIAPVEVGLVGAHIEVEHEVDLRGVAERLERGLGKEAAGLSGDIAKHLRIVLANEHGDQPAQ